MTAASASRSARLAAVDRLDAGRFTCMACAAALGVAAVPPMLALPVALAAPLPLAVISIRNGPRTALAAWGLAWGLAGAAAGWLAAGYGQVLLFAPVALCAGPGLALFARPRPGPAQVIGGLVALWLAASLAWVDAVWPRAVVRALAIRPGAPLGAGASLPAVVVLAAVGAGLGHAVFFDRCCRAVRPLGIPPFEMWRVPWPFPVAVAVGIGLALFAPAFGAREGPATIAGLDLLCVGVAGCTLGGAAVLAYLLPPRGITRSALWGRPSTWILASVAAAMGLLALAGLIDSWQDLRFG